MSEIEWSPWIEHDGSDECPVDGGVIAQISFSDGEAVEDYKIASSFSWGDCGAGSITHYRIPMEDYRRIYGKPDIEPDTVLQYEPDDVAFPAHSEQPMTGHDTVKPPAAASFLEAALGHMQDRASTYDAPEGERSMGKAVAAFNAVTDHHLSEEQGWLFMVLLKAVRTQQGAFRADNYEDGAAYFGLQGEAAARDRS